MPTYDYKCKTCGHRFEGRAKMSDPPLPCPEHGCGGETEKIFTTAPVHFRGGGWAADGYASTKPSLTVNQMLDRSSK